jgi:hypothetical protein
MSPLFAGIIAATGYEQFHTLICSDVLTVVHPHR